MKTRSGLSRRGLAVVLSFGLSGFACAPLPPAPTAPGRPESGPGSAQYVADEVRTTTLGEGALKVHIYEPDTSELASAPVIVFLHGYGGVNPRYYGAWLEHLARRGHIVLYPVYQDSLRAPELYTGNALTAVQNAYAELRAGGHILPDDTRLAMVGHSLGCVIAMNLAAVAHTSGLPRVQALMAANAGDTTVARKAEIPSIQTGNYEQIPAEMLFLGVVGADDALVGEETVLSLYEGLAQVAPADREVLEISSDASGEPVLAADHHAPLAIDADYDTGARLSVPAAALVALRRRGQRPTGDDSLNALDYYGYWKWCDALIDAAFRGTNREYALGATTQQLFLGTWSDGRPVTPARRIRPGP